MLLMAKELGITCKETIKLSQELDILILQYQSMKLMELD